jgi:hypothetical protein
MRGNEIVHSVYDEINPLDIVERLRTEKEYCEACNLYPCTKKVGMFDVDATPADCDCECHDLQRAAGDEIERLRAEVQHWKQQAEYYEEAAWAATVDPL